MDLMKKYVQCSLKYSEQSIIYYALLWTHLPDLQIWQCRNVQTIVSLTKSFVKNLVSLTVQTTSVVVVFSAEKQRRALQKLLKFFQHLSLFWVQYLWNLTSCYLTKKLVFKNQILMIMIKMSILSFPSHFFC